MPYTDDWRKESARMASIYQNSYITIAATKSANDHGGCFSAASPLDIDYPLSTKSSDKLSERTPHRIYVREKVLHFDDTQDLNSSTAYPFLTRGWIYQERLLAHRVLHFCQKELVWECRSLADASALASTRSLARLSSHREVGHNEALSKRRGVRNCK